MEELDEKIHLWISYKNCWHDNKASNDNPIWAGPVCSKCGKEFPKNPSYTTNWRDFGSLLEHLQDNTPYPLVTHFMRETRKWYISVGDIMEDRGRGEHESIKMALAIAIGELIDKEAK